jgi:pyruvate dehydrogenase E2 component (dihydrolipoamide acetyltransferase)
VSTSVGSRGEVLIEEPSPAQRVIARRAAESRATIPHVEFAAEVGMDACLALEQAQSCSRLAIVVKASALALRDAPRANAAYRDGRFERYSRVNVGVAVASGEAFAVPTVFDADRKPLGELSEELTFLAARAQAGELTPPELSGATFTINDLGAGQVAAAWPVIVPPNAAALGVGAVRAAAVVREGAVVAGRVMTIALACDHRILYGRQAAAFLRSIADRLEQSSV